MLNDLINTYAFDYMSQNHGIINFGKDLYDH